jgi:hypothetical protein
LLERLTRDAGIQGTPIVSRNRLGTKLFLTELLADHVTRVEIVSQDGVAFKQYASGRPVLDDNGELLAWVTNLQAATSASGVVKALAFATGEAIPIVFTNASPASFQFCAGGSFFLLEQPAKPDAKKIPAAWVSADQPIPFLTSTATNIEGYIPTWQGVFATGAPTNPLFRLPNDFYAGDIFVRSNDLVVSGFKLILGAGSKPGRHDLDKDVAWALVFTQDGGRYRLTKQLDLSKFVGIVDVDPRSSALLVYGKGEMFAHWGIFDPEKGSYKSLGSAGGNGFFLDQAFSEYIKRRWN